jgi:hypothetical protein
MRPRLSLIALAALAALPAAASAQPGDNAIDARVRASAEAAQGYQGQLDGAWMLTDTAGKPIYDLQLVERAGGAGALEGVFRDARGVAVAGDVGLIDHLERTAGPALTLSFHPQGGGAPLTIILKGGADGVWAGELREGDAVTAVKLRRQLDF